MKLTAVTNDIRIGELLAGNPSMHLLVSGGSLRPGSHTPVGEPGTRFLRRLHVDVALIGIPAINASWCGDTPLEVADASQCGQIAFFNAFGVNDNSRSWRTLRSPLPSSVV